MSSVRIKLACTLLLGVLVLAPFLATAARAADDTARFNGAWEISFPHNGQMLSLVLVHDASGFKNYVRLPDGSMPVGNGKFSAADGKYTATANKLNDSGTYRFTDNNTVVCTNAAGQTVTWKRRNAPLPSVIGTSAAYPTHVSATMNSVLAAARKSWMMGQVGVGLPSPCPAPTRLSHSAGPVHPVATGNGSSERERPDTP